MQRDPRRRNLGAHARSQSRARQEQSHLPVFLSTRRDRRAADHRLRRCDQSQRIACACIPRRLWRCARCRRLRRLQASVPADPDARTPYWAPGRRKFLDLHAANNSEIAQTALTRIAELYVAENEARSFNASARKDHRERHARPRIEQLYAWLTRLRPSSAAPSGIDHRRCGCAAACLASLARAGPFPGGI